MKLATHKRFRWVIQKQQALHDKWDHYWEDVADIRVDTGQWNFDVLSDDSLRSDFGKPEDLKLNDRDSTKDSKST